MDPLAGGPSIQAQKPVWGISHIHHDQSFPIKYCLSDLGGGRVYCSPELPCAYPAVLCLVWLFLMLSGLFQIDVSVVMAVSLLPRGAVPTITASGDRETWLIKQTENLVSRTLCQAVQIDNRNTDQGGEGRAAYLSSTCSLCALLHSVWYKLSRSFISHGRFYSHFIDKEMGGQRV